MERFIECPECNYLMTPQESHKLEKKDDIERAYIKCPNCGHEVDAYYTNSEIREKQKKIRRMYEKYSKVKKIILKEKLWENSNKLKKEIKEDMEKLRNEIQGRTRRSN